MPEMSLDRVAITTISLNLVREANVLEGKNGVKCRNYCRFDPFGFVLTKFSRLVSLGMAFKLIMKIYSGMLMHQTLN